eukprot:1210923-Rhodomonas_salina.1
MACYLPSRLSSYHHQHLHHITLSRSTTWPDEPNLARPLIIVIHSVDLVSQGRASVVLPT